MSFVQVFGWCLLTFSVGTGLGAVVAFNIAAAYHEKKNKKL